MPYNSPVFLSDRLRAAYRVADKPEAVLARLKGEIDPEPWFFDWGTTRPIVGKVGERDFRLRAPQAMRNSFHPYLFGTVDEGPDGSRIEVRLGLHVLVRLFMTIWLGVVGLGCIIGPLSLLVGEPREPWLFLVVPPAMLLGGMLMVRFGRWWGRSEEKLLMEFADRLWGPRVRP